MQSSVSQALRRHAIVFLVFILLFICWTLVISVDLLNLFGLRDAYLSISGEPMIFRMLFQGGGPVELMQWCFLFLSLTLVLVLAFRFKKEGSLPRSNTFAVGAIGLSLMLLEDVGDVRHLIGFQLDEWVYGTVVPMSSLRSYFDILFYCFISFFMVSFFLRAYRLFSVVPSALPYLVSGYLFYGIAAFSSASRYLGEWYNSAGMLILGSHYDHLNQIFFSGQHKSIYPLGFWIVDGPIEESLELLGAGALLSAFVFFKKAQSVQTEPE